MDREAAVEELGKRYRVRILVELEHGGVLGTVRGSTMVETAGDIDPALRGLVDVIAPKLLAVVDDPATATEEDRR